MANYFLVLSLLLVLDTSYTAFLPFVEQPPTGDIIEQTRTQADTLKNTLRSLARKPEAAIILKKVFAGQNNDCINNMDDALEAIETSTKLFENAGAEIKLLIKSVQEIQTIDDTPEAVRSTANIIRLLDVLIPKLTPSTSACQTTTADVFESMRSLGALVTDLSLKDDLYYSTNGRQTLKTSAQILSNVTNFLTKESSFKFEHFCTENKEYNTEFLTAVGTMMGDLAEFYSALGGLTAASELQNHEVFTKKVVARINNLGYLDNVSLDCNTPGSSQLVANTLDDLAGIIEDVGITNLCQQLDIQAGDCKF